ncbi:MAG: hypothetical protein MJK15_17425, partial [Colwellia sp.]|nr:hypothetical protein [Colwellia sp.]
MIKTNMKFLTKTPTRVLTSLFFAAALTACGGSSETIIDPIDPEPTTPGTTIEDEFGLWLNDLANNHVLPSYQNLQASSAALSSQTTEFCAKASNNNDELEVLQQSWRAVVASWQTIAWLKVGPIVNDNRIFRLHYWPDSKDNVGRGVTNLLASSEDVNEAFIAKQSVGSQGLPALERLL